ncbi:MAG: acyltransferase [Fidelibacterota bacterium]|nr:MAG: acyltransferase [Candidatus Neomarinimicrobiota bacterium]
MHIAVLQNQPHIGAVDANLAAVQSAVEDVAFDLLVLPELFATGYFFHDQSQVRRLGEQVPDGLTTRFLMELAATKKALVCGGLVEREGDRFYNSAVLVGPEGFIGCYRKLHLFYEEKLWFAPGDRPLEVYDWGTARIGMMVCYDWRFPEVARVLALKGAQVLLHPTNLVQPYCQDAMITRCLENRVFAVTANRVGSDTKPDGSSLTFTGRSQVVSPRGEVLCRTNVDDETVLTVDIDPGEADDKLVTEHNHLLSDRRPEYYDPVTGKQL